VVRDLGKGLASAGYSSPCGPVEAVRDVIREPAKQNCLLHSNVALDDGSSINLRLLCRIDRRLSSWLVPAHAADQVGRQTRKPTDARGPPPRLAEQRHSPSSV
jgi:hypothetical protein